MTPASLGASFDEALDVRLGQTPPC